jgi:hypothetical protein
MTDSSSKIRRSLLVLGLLVLTPLGLNGHGQVTENRACAESGGGEVTCVREVGSICELGERPLADHRAGSS